MCYWRCVQFEKECSARCVTNDGEFKSESGSHDHPAEAADTEKRKRISILKDSARNTQDTPAQIVAAASINMPKSVAGDFPTPMQLTRTIQKTRVAATGAPTNPTNLIDLVVPELYTKTCNGEEFLLFDSGPGVDRILLYSTKNNIRTLSQCEQWYANGTFKSSPPLFTQIFSIHGFKSGVTLPLVYGLLPNKEASYTRFLSALGNLSETAHVACQPISILTDFEFGTLNAFEAIFPNAERRGFYFHHAQCIWKHLQQVPAILAMYNSNPDFALHVRQLAAIAFVPVSSRILWGQWSTAATADWLLRRHLDRTPPSR